MRKIFLIIFLNITLIYCVISVEAMDFTAPSPPSAADPYMPEETESFGDGLRKILMDGIEILMPSLTEAVTQCAALIGIVILLSFADHFSGTSVKTVNLVGTVMISALMIQSSNTMIHLGIETVKEVTDYGNLLFPVLAGALAAQGAGVTSASLYAATAAFSALLSSAVSYLVAPMLYIYLVLTIANAATDDTILGKARDFVKWLVTWGLKISLYVFTGYMAISGVVTGSTDAARLKATKLTISGMVPVVGGILSDASESIIISAGIMKNSVGIYGLLVIGALWIEPFLKIGLQYLLLKGSSSICEVFSIKPVSTLLKGFSTAMGLVLAMTGAVCLMLLISVVCFMKGVS